MKKLLAILLACVFCLALVAACDSNGGSNDNGTGGEGGGGGGEPAASTGIEITLVNNKIEINEALTAYAAVYEQQTGVKVTVQSFGGETPYAPALTSLFTSGIEPEIYVFEGLAGFEEAQAAGRTTDLSGEAWVSDTDVAFHGDDGKIYGFPVAIEGWGLGYNKDLLDKAGVDPATLTNVGAIRAAFEKIDGMKDELEIDGVISMVAGPGMTWVTGLHGVNAYLTLGLPYDDSDKYIDMMLAGQVDSARLTKWAEYYNMLFEYANPRNLQVGGYDEQVTDFAIEKTVFIHQGNWIEPMLLGQLGASFPMGYAPHAFLDENTDGIFAAAPSFYLVNARSEHVEEAKKFLQAMASTAEGHDYMVNGAGMIPAFKSVTLKPAGALSQSVQEWANAGKIYNWKQNDMPSGFGMNALGPIFTEMAAGRIDVAKFVELVTAEVANIRAVDD